MNIMMTFLILCYVFTSSLLAEEKTSYVSGQLIVKFRQGVMETTDKTIDLSHSKLDVLNKTNNLISMKKIFSKTFSNNSVNKKFPVRYSRTRSDLSDKTSLFSFDSIFLLEFPADSDLISLAKIYRSQEMVVYAEPNYKVSCAMEPNDYHFSQQWALGKIKADKAWNITTGSSGVLIAVLDSGVDLSHEDLKSRIFRNHKEKKNGLDDDNDGFVDNLRGVNFIDSNNDITDRFGHGTFVTGIIVANSLNKIGIAGVDWYASVIPVKVISDDGEGDVVSLSRGIYYALNKGADIINLSITSKNSILLKDLIDYATSCGCVVVVAAGNNNSEKLDFPAGYENVLTVASCNRDDGKSEFSNYGEKVDVVAPGEDIISLRADKSIMPVSDGFNEMYTKSSGTSISCAYVSGMVSLMLSVNPKLNVDEIKSIVKNTSTKNDKMRLGLINVYQAVIESEFSADGLVELLFADDIKSQQLSISKIKKRGAFASSLLIDKLSDSDVQLSVGDRGILYHVLGILKSNRAVPLLIESLKTERNSYLRRNIIDALGKIGDPRAIDVLSGLLSDENDGIRARVVKAMGNIGTRNVNEILALKLDDPAEIVLSEVARALTKNDYKDGIPIFLDKIEDNFLSQPIKNDFIFAIGELGDRNVLSRLYSYRSGFYNQKPKESIARHEWKETLNYIDESIEKIEDKE